MIFMKRLLHWVQLVSIGDTLDCGDIRAIKLSC